MRVSERRRDPSRRSHRHDCGETSSILATYLATEVWPISMPSLRSSPWIRGAPQRGLARLMSRINWCISSGTFGLPLRDRDFHRQNKRKPARCLSLSEIKSEHSDGVIRRSRDVDRRCRGDVVAGAQVSRRLRQPVKFDQLAPRVRLSEASTHGASLSNGRTPANCASKGKACVAPRPQLSE